MRVFSALAPILKTDWEALQQSWNVHRLKPRLKTVTALLGRNQYTLPSPPSPKKAGDAICNISV